MADLFGSCACERNQYTVVIPAESTSSAHVFFDNGALSRRTQATPVTAWLRVPLEWYQSFTVAHFPDETHSAIKRTFSTPSTRPAIPPTRRQFCGYCGTHLTAYNEDQSHLDRPAYLDITLGSLLNKSLDKLEALNLMPDLESDDESSTGRGSGGAEGLVTGADINEEDHVATNEESMGGVDGPAARSVKTAHGTLPMHQMSSRGMPYFEEMVENSRLGGIRRRVGGHTSRDGSSTVQWEIVEVGADSEESMPDVSESNSRKRQKLDV